jgi:hypothetical protein
MIEIKTMQGGMVDIRWQEPFGSRRNTKYRDLADALEGIDGVEQVYIQRYSARLVVAEHLVDYDVYTVSADAADLLAGMLGGPVHVLHGSVR